MTTVNQPRHDIPIAYVKVNGRDVPCSTSRDFVRFFEDLVRRVGGSTGTNAPEVEDVANQALGLVALHQSLPQQTPDMGQSIAMTRAFVRETHSQQDFGQLLSAIKAFNRQSQNNSIPDETQAIIAGKVFGGR